MRSLVHNPIASLPKIYALIVAAGSGSRFGAPLPKQYLPIALHGKHDTVLQYSVQALAQSDDITECTLVVSCDDVIADTLSFALPIRKVVGGRERWQSVAAGVADIAGRDGVSADDLVLIHDAARPCLLAKDLHAVIDAAKSEPFGAILGAPVADTLKKTQHASPYVAHTISREALWQVQTPQVFRLSALLQVLEHIAQNSHHVTDEAMGFEALKLPVRMVTGSRSNIKLTFADDLPLVQAILAYQH